MRRWLNMFDCSLIRAASMSRWAWGFVVKLLAQAWVKQLFVQILVVVATIQMRTSKADVEKGSM